jgi:hypothetical protein
MAGARHGMCELAFEGREVVSLSVTHNETGAAIWWLVFALEEFCF